MAAPMNVERRRALRRLGIVVGGSAIAAPWVVSALHPGAIDSTPFASIEAALQTFERLRTNAPRMTGAWDLPHVLHHAAQSIEYSIEGFPQPKPAWFRATAGAYAFALFNARGRMSHSLVEPIPSAPEIAQAQALGPAVDHVTAALQAFARHDGALAPHFAFGALDKAAYTRAHLMHLANHWTEASTAST
jgi:Protein of unknown function (DUF1569)